MWSRGDYEYHNYVSYDFFFNLQEYMHEQQLSSLMQQRVMDFFDYLWVRNKGADRQTLLADMPYCMQAEVSMATTEPLMRNV